MLYKREYKVINNNQKFFLLLKIKLFFSINVFLNQHVNMDNSINNYRIKIPYKKR